jgi:hypothetical protein
MDNPFGRFKPFAEFGALLPKPKSERTIYRYTRRQKNPLPYIQTPGGGLIDMETGVAWMLSLTHMRNPERRKRRQTGK